MRWRLGSHFGIADGAFGEPILHVEVTDLFTDNLLHDLNSCRFLEHPINDLGW